MVVKTPVVGVIAEDALKFSQEQGIAEYVERAMQAAREAFTDAERVTASLKRDPEYGDLFVDISAVVPFDLDAEEQHRDACLAKWASFIPLDVHGKITLSSSWVK